MTASKIRIITIVIVATIMLVIIVSCCYDVFHEYPKICTYTDLTQKQIDVISNYYRLEGEKIRKIEKIVYESGFTDSQLYVFAEVDWPDLWSDYANRDSAYYGSNLRSEKFAGEESFTYDIMITFESSRDTFRSICIYRLMDDRKVVLYIGQGAARFLWWELKDSLE